MQHGCDDLAFTEDAFDYLDFKNPEETLVLHPGTSWTPESHWQGDTLLIAPIKSDRVIDATTSLALNAAGDLVTRTGKDDTVLKRIDLP